MKIKLLGSERACNTTANTWGSAKLVRVVNSNTTVRVLVTQKTNTAVTVGTLTLPPTGEAFIMKASTDTLESNNNADCSGVAVGFQD